MSSAIPFFPLVSEELADVGLRDDGKQVLAVGAKKGQLVCAKSSSGEVMWSKQLGEAMGDEGVVCALACTDEQLCYGTESKDGNFFAYICPLTNDGPDLTQRRLVARLTLSIGQMQFHPSLPYVGIASHDSKLYVQELVANTNTLGDRREFLGTMKGGTRSFAFDPANEYFAASTLAGDLHIFLFEKPCAQVHKCHVWPPSMGGNGPRQAPQFKPGSGQLLALPAAPQATSIKLLKRGDSWAEEAVLTGGHQFLVGCVRWTPSGDVLVSASEDSVTAWRPDEGLAPLWQCPPASQPYHLMVHSNTLAVGMHNGSISVINGSLESPPIAAKSKSTTVKPTKDVELESEAQEGETPVPTLELESTVAEEEEEEEVVIDRQGPVQPGATSRARRKFLGWNEHGIMRLYAAGEEVSDTGSAKNMKQPDRVEVEFSDRVKVIRDRAPEGLTLAALGPGVCAMAIGSDFLEGRPAQVRVVSSADFTKPLFEKDLSPGEDVDAIAAGRDYVVIATSRRFLQVMSLAGLPISISTLPGPIVTLAASDKLFLVVFHSSSPFGQDQCLEYWLLSSNGQTRLSSGRLPLSPGSTVKWAGFSTEAMPVLLDSEDMLRGLVFGEKAFCPGGSWVPLLDLAAASSKASSWWPVRAEGTEILCASVPKNSEPEAGPTYRLEAVKYHLPLGTSGEVNAEEAVLRERILSGHLLQALKEGSVPTPLRSGAESAKKQRVDLGGKSALRLFGALTDRGEGEKALQVANLFLSSYENHQTLLKEAEDFARKRSNPDLSEKVGHLKRSFAGISQD